MSSVLLGVVGFLVGYFGRLGLLSSFSGRLDEARTCWFSGSGECK